MQYQRWLFAGMCGALAAMPSRSTAQTEREESAARSIMHAFFGPNWNVFANGGASSGGRLLLQRATTPAVGERALRNEGGFNLGLGAGVDILPRAGFRFGYSYHSGELNFRTDNGDGSDVLDLEDVGSLSSHVVSLEIVRFMLPARASVSPYGSAGFVGTWWSLHDESTAIFPNAGSEFRFGATGSLGVQFAMDDHFSARLELATASIRNPFTGNDSYISQGGVTIDEPTRVNRTDFRVVGVYYFSAPELLQRPTRAELPNR